MGIFVLFLWIYPEESAAVPFPPTTSNTDIEILSYLVQGFSF